MITAVDTNIVLDFISGDKEFGKSSTLALRAASDLGRLVVCEIVFAELVSVFPDRDTASETLASFGIHFDPLGAEAAYRAGQAFRGYRKAGGPRQRVIADFLIGSHAFLQADQLLTRDMGYYKTYFPDLKLFS